ncbi:MAG: SNF2-related protein [Clostridia bacterium]
MANIEKYNKYLEVYTKTSQNTAENSLKWCELLSVMSNFHKYDYHEQVLIYAQNPKATACAEYRLWGNKMNRYVRSGASGIALIDPQDETCKIRYVFDISDTNEKKNAKTPYTWNFNEEYSEPLKKMFSEKYGVDEENIENAIHKLANNISLEYDNSEISETKQNNFKIVLEKSIEYSLLGKLSKDNSKVFKQEQHSIIFNNETVQNITEIGTAISQNLKPVLTDISKTIYLFERSKQYDKQQLQLQESRQRVSSRLRNGGTTSETSREIWNNEERLPQGAQSGIVQSLSPQHDPVPTSTRDTQDSKRENSNNNEPVPREKPTTEQRGISDRVGKAHDEFERRSGELRDKGLDIQLKQDQVTSEQTNLFTNIAEPIADEQSAQAPSESAISLEYKPFYQGYLDVKGNHQDDILLYRLGDFFEAYNADAEIMAEKLDLTLTKRNISINSDEKVTMVGIPAHSLDMYTNYLNAKGYNVLVCEKENEQVKTNYITADKKEIGTEKNIILDEKSDNIEVEGHIGTWYVIDKDVRNGKDYFLLEHEEYGDETAGLIVDENAKLVLDDVWNGFDDLDESEILLEDSNEPAINTSKTIMYSSIASEFVKSSSNFVDMELEVFTNEQGKEFALGYGNLGNGTTVWNYLDTESNDYKTVAHISETGTVKIYGDSLPPLAVAKINDDAEKFYPKEEWIEKVIKINDTYKFNALKVEIEAREISKSDYSINENFRGYTGEELTEALAVWEKKNIVSENQSPELIFFKDFHDLDIDYSKYNDGDVIGYNIDGVKYQVGKSGDMVYTTQTTSINPRGEILGDSMTSEVYDKFKAWKDSLNAPPVANRTEQNLYKKLYPYMQPIIENKTDYLKFKSEGYEDLVIENIGYGEYSIAHYYEQNGDLMRDPEITFKIENNGIYPTSFLQDSIGQYYSVDDVSPKVVADLKSFMITWFDNISHQNFKLEKKEELIEENYHITNYNLGIGTKSEKIRNNIEAIETLQTIESENRLAMDSEKEILSKYVGWGGLAEVFEENNNNFNTLKSLLNDEEYSNARATVQNAHYTSPTIINAMYKAIGNMGFETGNILEPSCGVGNFFGMLPENMKNSNLYGVELDSVTGRIAQKLYPQANIDIKGFEKTEYPDNFFDVAIGNVPFGNYKLYERKYEKNNFLIHDHFFAKSLDKIRAGGVVAFVTSKGTLDKENPKVRRYLAQRAELLGAIRLPDNAFKANAGTDVTSDIIFLQKRERPIDIECDWAHLGYDENNISINSYFVENPHMVLGKMEMVSSQYGMKSTCTAFEGANLSEQLDKAINNIVGEIDFESSFEEISEKNSNKNDVVPADPRVKNYSYAVIDNNVYYRQNSTMTLQKNNLDRIKGLIEVRSCLNEVIRLQLEEYSSEAIEQSQKQLNEIYDSFTKKHGLISSKANAKALAEDNSYHLLTSLENLNDDGTLKEKSAIFTKRTIKNFVIPTSAETPSEALAISIGKKGYVDVNYMAELLGDKYDLNRLVVELNGIIFKDPLHCGEENEKARFFTADEYLSGNVREKLGEVKCIVSKYPEFQNHIDMLELVQPKDLEASEIEVRLGATWIDKKYIRQFMYETLQTPDYLQVGYNSSYGINVDFSPVTGEWNITSKNAISSDNVLATATFGTERANAYRLLEDCLNLRDTRIYDTVTDIDGKEKRVINRNETEVAQQKQDAIKEKFREWIWNNQERRQFLTRLYNDKFNSTRPREYDGSHITFGGINPEITLKEHQINAIARIIYGNNTLLAHEVGAGKSFEMIAGVMEKKRLGLCNKALIAVPNHLTEQMAGEFLRLYPSANILVATKKDFETKNRKKFCARIATGEYDAIIIGHSQFERIPISQERQERMLNEQIQEVLTGINELKYKNSERFTIRQLERTRKKLEERLEKMQANYKKDDVVTFEQLGVDMLVVDEAHAYKNGFVFTKMRNIAGLSTTESQKSADMLLKCRYLDEITGGKGVVFATGTPVMNSMSELYVMQRYLQYATVKRQNLMHFDSWASTFATTSTESELAPEGTGFRLRTRFSKFFNLPELMNMFKEVADIKTADQLDLPTPTMTYTNVVTQPTEIQKEMIQSLSQRSTDVHNRKVDPSADNMLKITSDGRKIGLDQRLFNTMLPDDPNSKVNACINNVFKIWEDNKAEKLTQLIFCDMSTPKAKANSKEFCVYDDIREKLVSRGVPREEIAFIHEAKTEVQKQKLFEKMRTGSVRVMIGSTSKCGAGMNVQDRLVAMHDLDAPWRPGDLRQRSGRIERQGNMNKEAHIFRYVTDGTFDAYLWQTLEKKQKFISQIMTSKSPVRSCDDLDEFALSCAEVKALCAGDPNLKLAMDLSLEISKLKIEKADYKNIHYRLEDNITKKFPEDINNYKIAIAGLEKDMLMLKEKYPIKENFFNNMTIDNIVYKDKEIAGLALITKCKSLLDAQEMQLGTYRGMDMFLHYNTFSNEYNLRLKGEISHHITLGDDPRGNILRIDNELDRVEIKIFHNKNMLENVENQLETAKSELSKPFTKEDILSEKVKQLEKLETEMSLESKAENPQQKTQQEPKKSLSNEVER